MNKKAFTLIELLVVVLIIGILAAIALPQYQKAVIKSRVSTILPVLRAIKDAQEVYYMANEGYTEDVSELGITLPANCSAIEGGDGGLYKCGNLFLLDLDGLPVNGGKINASYCPDANASWGDCISARSFEIRLVYDHDMGYLSIAGKFVCMPITEEGTKICKALGAKNSGLLQF